MDQTSFNTEEIITKINEQIAQNPIIIYMKGSPEMPQCGFSARTVQALMECGEEFAFVDILAHPEIRATLPQVHDWPTFPQVYVKGELIGGCDIVCEMHENDELEPIIKTAKTN